jgi:uncharacterized protein
LERENILKRISLFFIICTFSFGSFSAFSKSAPKKIEVKAAQAQLAAQSKTAAASAIKSEFARPPALKADEYAIFLDDSYKIFKTKKFQKLELALNCFKKDKPVCNAYEHSGIKPKNLSLKHESMNNMAAVHCEAVGGRNLIALDSKNNQFNFCWFYDGSMVNSWSMYYKHNPSEIIRK